MFFRVFFRWLIVTALIALINVQNQALAQTFTTTTTGTIDDTVLCAGVGGGTVGNLVRTITVSGVSGTISDLDLGFLANHSWRGDLSLDLTSPSPSPVTVSLFTLDTGTDGSDDNYNIQLDDEGFTTVNTGTVDGDHDTAVSPYEFIASPNNSLSAFDGLDPNGVWTLTMCDGYAGENGSFLQADLFITASSAPNADLALNITPSTSTPYYLDPVTIAFEITNSGNIVTTGVTAQINLPPGLSFDSAYGDGTYDDTTGLWTLAGAIAPGTTQTLILTAVVQYSGSYNVNAEIETSDEFDPDSTPGNASTSEDDDDSATLSPLTNPTPPSLSCSATDQFSLAWGAPGTATGWTSGNLTQSYTVSGEPLSFSITGDTSFFGTIGTETSPVTSTLVSGGESPSPYGVLLFVDFPSDSEEVTTTISLGTAGTGVEAVQFQIFDVDIGSFADRVLVTGSLGGVTKSPIYTTNSANIVVGNEVHGTADSPSASAAGNVTITFNSAVDEVVMTYGNHSASDPDPGTQGIVLQALTMCPRLIADMSAVKLVEVYDPLNTGGIYMTPGNDVLYKIIVTNSDTATANADDIDLTDTLPSNLTFIEATATGFTGGVFGTPALPAVNQDCGAIPCVIRFSGGSVPIDTTAEVIVRAKIK